MSMSHDPNGGPAQQTAAAFFGATAPVYNQFLLISLLLGLERSPLSSYLSSTIKLTYRKGIYFIEKVRIKNHI